MRTDNQYIQERFVPFLKDIFRDVRKSETSFYEYFDPDMRRKRAFKESEKIDQYMFGANSLFENEGEAKEKAVLLVDSLFGRMLKDFHDRQAHLYIPNEDGEFRWEQEEILFKLARTLISKQNLKETELAEIQGIEGGTVEAKRQKAEKIAKETTEKLIQHGGLQVVGDLKLNSDSGLIEGVVRNPADHDGATLTVKIDPENPDSIAFTNLTGDIAFMTENSKEGLSNFEHNTEEMTSLAVMVSLGYMPTKGGVPRKRPRQTEPAKAQGQGAGQETGMINQIPEIAVADQAESEQGESPDLGGMASLPTTKTQSTQEESVEEGSQPPEGPSESDLRSRMKGFMKRAKPGVGGLTSLGEGGQVERPAGSPAQTQAKPQTKSPTKAPTKTPGRMTDTEERAANKGQPVQQRTPGPQQSKAASEETAAGEQPQKKKGKSMGGRLLKYALGGTAALGGGIVGGLSIGLV